MITEGGLSRRSFLKLGGAGAVAVGLSYLGLRGKSGEQNPLGNAAIEAVERHVAGKNLGVDISEPGASVERDAEVSESTVIEEAKKVWGVEGANIVPEVMEAQMPESVGVESENLEVVDGRSLLEHYGLVGKVIYGLYGRPQKYEGQQTWGSLMSTMTAEEGWDLVKSNREYIANLLGWSEDRVAINILNPVYVSNGDKITDIYMQKALEIAHAQGDIVAPSFNSLEEAKSTLEYFASYPAAYLASFSMTLDAEWFGGGKIDARDINEFVAEYATKHKQWGPERKIPGIVGIYVIDPVAQIPNLGELKQYYPEEGVMVVLICDGFGTSAGKLVRVGDAVAGVNNTIDNPALVSVMEFRTLWGDTYDKSPLTEIVGLLEGAPVEILFSQ